MILPILAYGSPVLKKLANDITPNYPNLNELISNMWETMYAAKGVGLAAPQIGLSIRLFVIDATPFLDDENYYFVNEEIVWDLKQASYPKHPYFSFLDHILVSKNFIKSNSINDVLTIPMDEYMNGYEIYEQYISDHMPILLSFNINLNK